MCSCYLDINECSLGIDDCEQSCINNRGSFNCTCFDGYMLLSDGWSCTRTLELFHAYICYTYLVATIFTT